MNDVLVALLVTASTAATPLLFAALGETVAERAGVLNLGVEGMMLAGAVAAFAAAYGTGSHALGVLAGAGAGAALAGLFAALTLGLASNQVATGLALAIFGAGVSTLAGAGLVGQTVAPLPKLDLPGLSDLPVVGPLLFRHDALVYGAVALAGGTSWALWRTRAGLVLRAVGEDAASAHAVGHRVLRTRALAALFGGAMAGLGGAYLSLAYTPLWAEGMTAGRGWIALALVVFGAWRPWRVAAGAALFGGLAVLQLYVQGSGRLAVPTQALAALPYLATVLVLALSSSGARARRGAPADLGKPFWAPG